MTWFALGLLGVGLTDLAFSFTRRPRLAEAVGAASVVVAGLLTGMVGAGTSSVLALLVVVAVVVAWGESVTYGFGSRRVWIPLVVLGVGLLAGVLASGTDPDVGGPLGDWLDATSLGVLDGLPPERFLLLAGAAVVQLSTGNVIVRLVLAASGTTNPLRTTRGQAPAPALKGGRLLGPMERLFILGLGLAGEITAASIVIAAKGLLRFPEISASRTASSGGREPGIHEVTEYFLVGSFVSWLVPLTCLAVAAR